MRKQIRPRFLTFGQEMGEFQNLLTAYKLFGVNRTMGIILNKQCVSLSGTTGQEVRVKKSVEWYPGILPVTVNGVERNNKL